MGRGKKWTKQELTFLEENLGELSVVDIAAKLGKPHGAIINKANRVGKCNTSEISGLYTLNELANTIGYSRRRVGVWVTKYKLPSLRKTLRTKRSFIYVDPIKFWKWAEKHKDMINFLKIKKNCLPPEPEWVEGERERLKKELAKNHGKPWTTGDIQHLKYLLYSKGYTYKKAAAELGRKETAVQVFWNRYLEQQRSKRA